MSAGVLLGGRSPLRIRSRWGAAVSTWLPVVVMLLVIARESTEAFSSENTSGFLRPLLQALVGVLGDAVWGELHHVLRKCGHFLGYGIQGLCWFRAFLLTWLGPLRLQPASRWRGVCLRMAICCTAMVAALDEWHQTYLPDRTGLATDVLLDTSGALTLCAVAFLLSRWRTANGG